MSELREAAQEALFWMQHARLHLTIKERLHPDGLIQYDNAARNLRAALAQPKTELRDQHKAFAEWFLQQNPIAPNVEDMAWSAWKAALAAPENRPCTCHPGDNPPQPCAQRYALTECKALAQPETEAHPPRDEWRPAIKKYILCSESEDFAEADYPTDFRAAVALLERKRAEDMDGDTWTLYAEIDERDVQPPTEGSK